MHMPDGAPDKRPRYRDRIKGVTFTSYFPLSPFLSFPNSAPFHQLSLPLRVQVTRPPGRILSFNFPTPTLFCSTWLVFSDLNSSLASGRISWLPYSLHAGILSGSNKSCACCPSHCKFMPCCVWKRKTVVSYGSYSLFASGMTPEHWQGCELCTPPWVIFTPWG